LPKNHIQRSPGGKSGEDKNIFLLSQSLLQFLFFSSHCKALGRKRREENRRRPLFAARLLKRLYRAWQRGLACPSLVVLFILCAVQGVSNALGLCVVRETTHHILSSVPSWGMGRLKEEWGGCTTEGVGDKKQTYRRPPLFKAVMHKGL